MGHFVGCGEPKSMKDWFDIAGPILLGITIGLESIAFRYILGIPPKASLVFAILLTLMVLIMPEINDYIRIYFSKR